jgi:nucleotide-binding universal stress UspA family protein
MPEPTPAAIMPRNDQEGSMNDKPILICFDGSDASRRSIEAAASLFGPRHAVVLDIAPEMTAVQSLAAVQPVVPGNAFEELNADDALKRAQAGADLARQAGFEAEARSRVEAPYWQGIVDVADEIDAAVIVIGSRGLSGAREAFKGSVSHEVTEHSDRPVLIVPPLHGSR